MFMEWDTSPKKSLKPQIIADISLNLADSSLIAASEQETSLILGF